MTDGVPADGAREHRVARPTGPDILEPERIRLFSDAVFGVAITLLFVDLARELPAQTIPDIATIWTPAAAPGQDFWAQARDFGHQALPLVASVIPSAMTVGTFWIAHYNVFHFIKKADRRLLWINNFLLMGVALMPILTHLMFKSILEAKPATATAVYGLGLFACSGMLLGLWTHARRKSLLNISPEAPLSGLVARRMTYGLWLYGLGIVLSLVSLWMVSVVLYACMQVFYMQAGDIDAYIERRAAQRHIDESAEP